YTANSRTMIRCLNSLYLLIMLTIKRWYRLKTGQLAVTKPRLERGGSGRSPRNRALDGIGAAGVPLIEARFAAAAAVRVYVERPRRPVREVRPVIDHTRRRRLVLLARGGALRTGRVAARQATRRENRRQRRRGNLGQYPEANVRVPSCHSGSDLDFATDTFYTGSPVSSQVPQSPGVALRRHRVQKYIGRRRRCGTPAACPTLPRSWTRGGGSNGVAGGLREQHVHRQRRQPALQVRRAVPE